MEKVFIEIINDSDKIQPYITVVSSYKVNGKSSDSFICDISITIEKEETIKSIVSKLNLCLRKIESFINEKQSK